MGFDRDALLPFLKATSTISIGMFAGGAIYINVVEHPSRMTLDTKACHKQWKESFDRARVFMGSLALIGAVSSVGVYICKPSSGLTFLLGGCTMALVLFPYSQLLLKPASIDPIYADYDKLVARESEEFVRNTIEKWNKYHAVRSVLSFTALVELVAQIIHETPFF